MINIVTHGRHWHADEVLAIALIAITKNVSLSELNVVRTIDEQLVQEKLLDRDTYVLDIGMKHEPHLLNFDHHHADFKLTNMYDNKLSTFGLMLEHFKGYYPFQDYKPLYEFANRIDCQDNGIQAFPECFWISNMNSLGDFDKVLRMAYDWLSALFVDYRQYAQQNKDIQDSVSKAVNGIVFSQKPLPIDERLNQYSNLMLTVSFREHDKTYGIRSLNEGSEVDFSMRCPAPEAWRGLRGEELQKASGLPGLIFCHSTGFLTVADTAEHAMLAAEYIVEHNKKHNPSN